VKGVDMSIDSAAGLVDSCWELANVLDRVGWRVFVASATRILQLRWQPLL